MQMIQKVGDDFTKSIRLNLFPGVDLAPGYWNLEISCGSAATYNNYSMTAISTQHSKQNFTIIVGQDVHSIHVRAYRISLTAGHADTQMASYTMTVRHLHLLNLADRLLHPSTDI